MGRRWPDIAAFVGYLSRTGDFKCWAIFDGTNVLETAPAWELKRDDPAFVSVDEDYRLTLHQVRATTVPDHDSTSLGHARGLPRPVLVGLLVTAWASAQRLAVRTPRSAALDALSPDE